MKKQTLRNKSNIISVPGAGLLWGTWAYFSNIQGHPTEVALKAAITQGVYSSVMTLYMVFSVYFFWTKTKHTRLAKIWPTILTAGHTGCLLVLAHTLNHTPNILRTVCPPIAVTTLFCLFLTAQYNKTEQTITRDQ